MLLTDILEKNVKEYPDRTALVMQMGYRSVTLSYGDVYDLSLKVACFLESNGVEKGDKVLLLAPNSPYWICIFWGSLLRGSILVPLNTQSTGEMVGKVAQQTGAKIIFTHQAYKEHLPPDLKRYDIEFFKELIVEIDPHTKRGSAFGISAKSAYPRYGVGVDSSKFKKVKAKDSDVVEIMYTSGTTGDPKGVKLTHQNLSTNVEAVTETAFRTLPISRFSPGIVQYRLLSILPLTHIFEQIAGFLVPFLNTAQIVYAHSPGAISELLKKHQINILVAVPEFLGILMNRIEMRMEEKGKKKFFDRLLRLSQTLRLKLIQRLLFYPVHKEFGGKLYVIISGGAPLDLELERKFSALGIYVFQGYGLTETSPVISLNIYRGVRTGSVGKILPGVEVKIGADGEILVRGLNVFEGYFKNEKKTKEVFTDQGWFKTGDIGGFDKDGFLYIKGRKKYMIKGPGAQNVFPEDIETELNKIPGLEDSCVVGLEKPGRQVQIHAVLLLDREKVKKLSPNKFAEKAIKEANKKLASYQKITDWSIWPEDDFPRSATRKVKKEDVLKWLRAKQEKMIIQGVPEKEKITSLMKLLSEITGTDISKVTPSSRIIQKFNIDSLLRVEITARIKEKFGVSVDEQKIDVATTISDLETMIAKREPVKEQEPLAHWPRSLFISLIRNSIQTILLFPFFRIFVRLKVEGKEHLKNLSLPAIFMPNHISFLDPVVLAMALPFNIRKRITFAAAADVIYGTYRSVTWLVDMFLNSFPFPRQEGEQLTLGFDFMGKLLDRNWSIVVFPEGRMSESGKLQPLKSGAGLAAIEMDSYVVPVKITGTNQILPYGKFIPRRRSLVTVKFGKPIKFSRANSYIQATKKIQELIQKL